MSVRKLTYEIAQEIRQRYAGGDISQHELAQEYSVTQSVIWNILHRKIWVRLPNAMRRCTCGFEGPARSEFVGRECRRCYQRRTRHENRDEANRRQRAYYARNKERIRATNRSIVKRLEQQADAHESLGRGYNTTKAWVRRLRLCGLTPKDYHRMFEAQNGLCAICRTADTGRFKVFAIDHCHRTDAVRGLLCDKCNRGLGMFNDSIAMLEQAIAYLQQTEVEQ